MKYRKIEQKPATSLPQKFRVIQPENQPSTMPDAGVSSFDQFKNRYNSGMMATPEPASAVDDRIRGIARGVPIIGGAMDEISAGLNTGFGLVGDYGKALEAERQRDKQFDAAHPTESTALGITGGLLGGGALAKSVGSLPTPASLPGKVGAGAGTGGLLGAWEAFTRGEGGFDNRWEAAKKAAGPSAVIGGVLPLIGYGMGKVYDAFKKPEASGLTTQGLKDQAAPLFEEARNANITLRPEAYDDMIGRLKANLGKGSGYVPENMKELTNAITALEQRSNQPITFDELMNLRSILKSAETPTNPSQQRLLGKTLDDFDSLVNELQPNAFVGDADPQSISNVWTKARDYWTRAKNAELLDTMVENAKNAVGANYTDAQFQTAIRQQLRGIAKNNFENYRWLKPAERDAILTVIRGEGLENTLRKIGKYSPLTLGGAARVGGLTYVANTLVPGSGPLIGGLLSAGGAVSAPLANQLSKRNTALLGETLLQGKEVLPQQTADELARLGLIYGAPIAGRSGAPVAGLLGSGGGGW